MLNNASTERCRICDGVIDPCVNPLGAHLLCAPSAECRHEICELLGGDSENDWPISPATRIA